MTRYREAHTVRVCGRDRESIAAPLPFLADISQGLHTATDVAPYEILLDQALADLQLTTDERTELRCLASDLGLDTAAVRAAHTHFLHSAIDVALDAALVTDDEIDRLLRVAALLDLPAEVVTSRTHPYRTESVTVELVRGNSSVLHRRRRSPARRARGPRARIRARAAPSMTKAVDVLAAADPATMSGKAKSVHKYGKPLFRRKTVPPGYIRAGRRTVHGSSERHRMRLRHVRHNVDREQTEQTLPPVPRNVPRG